MLVVNKCTSCQQINCQINEYVNLFIIEEKVRDNYILLKISV